MKISAAQQKLLIAELRSLLVGSLPWLSQGTRPDIATATSLLAQHQSNPAHHHIRAAQHVIKYIKGTKSMGIHYTNKTADNFEAHMNFPVKKNTLIPLTDANWGAQDQAVPDQTKPQ